MTTRSTALPIVSFETSADKMINAAMRERYSTPAVVVAAMKQAGKHMSLKLLRLIESDKFDTLPVSTQLRVAEFVFDRAFGKADSSVQAMALSTKISGSESLANSGNSKRIRELEGKIVFPEMSKARPAARAIAEIPDPDPVVDLSEQGADGDLSDCPVPVSVGPDSPQIEDAVIKDDSPPEVIPSFVADLPTYAAARRKSQRKKLDVA